MLTKRACGQTAPLVINNIIIRRDFFDEFIKCAFLQLDQPNPKTQHHSTKIIYIPSFGTGCSKNHPTTAAAKKLTFSLLQRYKMLHNVAQHPKHTKKLKLRHPETHFKCRLHLETLSFYSLAA